MCLVCRSSGGIEDTQHCQHVTFCFGVPVYQYSGPVPGGLDLGVERMIGSGYTMYWYRVISWRVIASRVVVLRHTSKH